MKISIAAALLLFLSACTTLPKPTTTPQSAIPTPKPTNTYIPTMTDTPETTPSPSTTPTSETVLLDGIPVPYETVQAAGAEACKEFVSQYLSSCLTPGAYLTYAAGIESGNNPHAFIVIGDSNSVPAVFMGQYEYCCSGDFGEIAEWFAGSFSYSSSLRINGLSVMDISLDELAQEIRKHNPSLAFIALDSNTGGSAEAWAQRYELVVLALMEDFRVLPVLWTITDMPRLNVMIRSLAEKHGLPLVEWAPIGLPYLSDDGVHFTVEGWTVRSRVGLQVLHQLRGQIMIYDELVLWSTPTQ